MALLDVVHAAVSNSHGTVAIAQDVHTEFLAAGRPGDRLVAEGVEVHRSNRTAVYRIEATAQDGRLVATALARVFRNRSWPAARPQPGRRRQRADRSSVARKRTVGGSIDHDQRYGPTPLPSPRHDPGRSLSRQGTQPQSVPPGARRRRHGSPRQHCMAEQRPGHTYIPDRPARRIRRMLTRAPLGAAHSGFSPTLHRPRTAGRRFAVLDHGEEWAASPTMPRQNRMFQPEARYSTFSLLRTAGNLRLAFIRRHRRTGCHIGGGGIDDTEQSGDAGLTSSSRGKCSPRRNRRRPLVRSQQLGAGARKKKRRPDNKMTSPERAAASSPNQCCPEILAGRSSPTTGSVSLGKPSATGTDGWPP